jgi:hypothetical protein
MCTMRLVVLMIGGGRIRRGSGCCAGIQAVVMLLHIWITSLYLNIVCFHLYEGAAAAASDTAGLPDNFSGYVRPPAGHNVIPVQMLAGLAQATEPDQVLPITFSVCGFTLIHSLWVWVRLCESHSKVIILSCEHGHHCLHSEYAISSRYFLWV